MKVETEKIISAGVEFAFGSNITKWHDFILVENKNNFGIQLSKGVFGWLMENLEQLFSIEIKSLSKDFGIKFFCFKNLTTNFGFNQSLKISAQKENIVISPDLAILQTKDWQKHYDGSVAICASLKVIISCLNIMPIPSIPESQSLQAITMQSFCSKQAMAGFPLSVNFAKNNQFKFWVETVSSIELSGLCSIINAFNVAIEIKQPKDNKCWEDGLRVRRRLPFTTISVSDQNFNLDFRSHVGFGFSGIKSAQQCDKVFSLHMCNANSACNQLIMIFAAAAINWSINHRK